MFKQNQASSEIDDADIYINNENDFEFVEQQIQECKSADTAYSAVIEI